MKKNLSFLWTKQRIWLYGSNTVRIKQLISCCLLNGSEERNQRAEYLFFHLFVVCRMIALVHFFIAQHKNLMAKYGISPVWLRFGVGVFTCKSGRVRCVFIKNGKDIKRKDSFQCQPNQVMFVEIGYLAYLPKQMVC